MNYFCKACRRQRACCAGQALRRRRRRFYKKEADGCSYEKEYEQQCIAAALKQIGVPVLKSLKQKNLPEINAWLDDPDIIEVDYPDHVSDVIDRLLDDFKEMSHGQYSEVRLLETRFKKSLLQKIVAAYINA